MLKQIRPLVENGFAVHLLHPRSKRPIGNDWANAPVLTFEQLKKRFESKSDAFGDDCNFGVRLGKPSKVDGGYLHVIDVDIRRKGDVDDAMSALKKLFPGVEIARLPCVRSGSDLGASRHYYFVTDDPFPSKKLKHSGKKFTDKDGHEHWTWEIELFGTGKQVAIPPSIHPDSGLEYDWRVEAQFPDFERIDVDLIGDLVHAGRDEDEDDDSDPVVPDLDIEAGREYLWSLAHLAEDRESWLRAGMAIKTQWGEKGWPLFDLWSATFGGKAYNRSENRKDWLSLKTTGKRIVTFKSIISEANAKRREEDIAALLGEDDDEDEHEEETEERQEKRIRRGDPDMTILHGARVPAPKPPLDIFGKRMAAEIVAQARGAAAPVDYVVAAILGGASAVIGNALRVTISDTFEQPAILWGQVIGNPSAKKSPALRIVTSILNQLQDRYEPFYIKQVQAWEEKKAIADIKRKAWEGKVRAMVAEGKEAPDAPDDCVAPPEPPERKMILNDLTIEAFMRAQVRNPRGFMVFRDELAGWLGNMERYSDMAEKGAWLESYDGGSYAINRVKEGNKTIKVRHICAPILGGIQPERLLAITAQTVADDGLQARFLPFWPDDEIIPMAERGVDKTWLFGVFEKLADVAFKTDDGGNYVPTHVPLSKEAFREFKAWSDKRQFDERHIQIRLAGPYNKSTGQVARIALVIEFIWWATKSDFDDDYDPPKVVSVEAVRAAIRFREEYVKVMQRRVYTHSIEATEVTNARLIAEWIVNERAEKVNARMLRREAGIKGFHSGTESQLVDDAIAVLVALRWLTPEEVEKQGRGRPSKNYVVNERVWELLNE